MTSLEKRLREIRASGRRALVPYFMAGLSPHWLDHVRAAAFAGADAVEVGLPFSDPMMDGVVIQMAAQRSLERATTFDSVMAELSEADLEIPVIAMTYYNVFLHGGLEKSADLLHTAGVSGVIVPDVPLEEAGPWESVCAPLDLATIYMAAPSTPTARLADIARRTQGFCYAAARMSVTGAADDDGGGAREIVDNVRRHSDVPTYVGIGISRPEQARQVTRFSDGAIVGSALVARLLNDVQPSEVESFIGDFRSAIDA